MYGYIYETTNLINGKKYIGQHRGEFDLTYIGSGIVIYKALKKYGKENFTVKILKIAKNKKELNYLEKNFIEINNAVKSKHYYNIHEGGIGGDTFSGKTHSKEVRKKMSKSKKENQVDEKVLLENGILKQIKNGQNQ